jgi:hypothetical protein
MGEGARRARGWPLASLERQRRTGRPGTGARGSDHATPSPVPACAGRRCRASPPIRARSLGCPHPLARKGAPSAPSWEARSHARPTAEAIATSRCRSCPALAQAASSTHRFSPRWGIANRAGQVAVDEWLRARPEQGRAQAALPAAGSLLASSRSLRCRCWLAECRPPQTGRRKWRSRCRLPCRLAPPSPRPGRRTRPVAPRRRPSRRPLRPRPLPRASLAHPRGVARRNHPTPQSLAGRPARRRPGPAPRPRLLLPPPLPQRSSLPSPLLPPSRDRPLRPTRRLRPRRLHPPGLHSRLLAGPLPPPCPLRPPPRPHFRHPRRSP